MGVPTMTEMAIEIFKDPVTILTDHYASLNAWKADVTKRFQEGLESFIEESAEGWSGDLEDLEIKFLQVVGYLKKSGHFTGKPSDDSSTATVVALASVVIKERILSEANPNFCVDSRVESLFDNFPEDARELILNLLDRETDKRATAAEALAKLK
jgi:hypothetical protein